MRQVAVFEASAHSAVKGIGGSGLLSLPYVILPEVVEPQKYALWASFTSFAFVLSFLIGPLVGGAVVGVRRGDGFSTQVKPCFLLQLDAFVKNVLKHAVIHWV